MFQQTFVLHIHSYCVVVVIVLMYICEFCWLCLLPLLCRPSCLVCFCFKQTISVFVNCYTATVDSAISNVWRDQNDCIYILMDKYIATLTVGFNVYAPTYIHIYVWYEYKEMSKLSSDKILCEFINVCMYVHEYEIFVFVLYGS